jgi:hypothetical protein
MIFTCKTLSVHEFAGLHWCTAGKQASSTLSSYITFKHLLQVEGQQMPFCIFITEICFRILHKEVLHVSTA